MNNILVDIKNVVVHYGEQCVLNDISLHIQSGDYIGLIGPNGGGKTTLVKVLLGLLSPSGGVVTKQNVGNQSLKIGYLPQKNFVNDNFFPATVEEIVKIGLLATKKHPKNFQSQDEVKVRQVLQKLGVEQLRKKRIGTLSGGQQQRVLLARAIVSNPDVLVMDEPTSALDPQIRDEFYNLMKKLNEEGVTILLVTHDISTIGKYTNKMIYLDKKLIFYGTYDTFSKSDEMKQYFGKTSQTQMCGGHKHG